MIGGVRRLTRPLSPQSVRWYVSQLEQTVISACSSLGVVATTSPHTGVWVGDNKICAIGRYTPPPPPQSPT